MENELRKRLTLFMEMNELSVNSLAKVIKVQARTLNNQINAETTIPATVVMGVLNAYENLSSEWLLRGHGSMYIGEYETMDDLKEKYTADIKQVNKVLHQNIPTPNESLNDIILRQQREIDGLYERIDELKKATSIAAPHSVTAV